MQNRNGPLVELQIAPATRTATTRGTSSRSAESATSRPTSRRMPGLGVAQRSTAGRRGMPAMQSARLLRPVQIILGA
jgi:hypothetical protein